MNNLTKITPLTESELAKIEGGSLIVTIAAIATIYSAACIIAYYIGRKQADC